MLKQLEYFVFFAHAHTRHELDPRNAKLSKLYKMGNPCVYVLGGINRLKDDPKCPSIFDSLVGALSTEG